MWFKRQPKPEDNPELKEAMDARDEVLAEATDAIREAGVKNQIIDEYVAAELQRVKNGEKR